MKPATSYKFNSMQEIKSHSSVLYNERMAILFYLLDMKSIELNNDMENVDMIRQVRSINKQIYKDMRMLLSYNPVVRNSLNLNTKEKGIYVTDVVLGTIDMMYLYCQTHGYTSKKCYIIVSELDNFEVLIKKIFQYYHYFVRPEFRQKPDILLATEKYKTMADQMTLDQLRGVVGKNNKSDFDSLKINEVDDVDDDAYLTDEE